MPDCKALIVNALSEWKKEIVSFIYSDCGSGKNEWESVHVSYFKTIYREQKHIS